MRKPNHLLKAKFEDLVPFHELGLDVESEKAIEIGQQLKDFYFGFTDLTPETVLVYLMVISLACNNKKKQLDNNFRFQLILPFSDSHRQIFLPWPS